MFGLGKKREFLLKLLLAGLLLFGLSFISVGYVWLGLFGLLFLSFALRYKSTEWVFKKLDLGPNSTQKDDIHLIPIIERLCAKYGIKKPKLFKSQVQIPLVLGLGHRDDCKIVYSAPFFNKLSQNEKEALLEIAIHKIESDFCRNIEFVTHLNSIILFVGSKLDLVIAFIIGLKRNKNIQNQHYILFSRFSILAIRLINYFYMNPKIFFNFDKNVYQNNPHLILALNKSLIYAPLELRTIDPLLCPFNFCNFPRYVNWHRHFEIQPHIETRLNNFHIERNLMLQSLTI